MDIWKMMTSGEPMDELYVLLLVMTPLVFILSLVEKYRRRRRQV